MKSSMMFVGLLTIGLQAACSVTQSSQRVKTQWEIANQVVMDEFVAERFTPVEALYRMYMNCTRFTEYSFQRELCTTASKVFSVDSAETRVLSNEIWERRHTSTLSEAVLYYPFVPHLKRLYDDCMRKGNVIQKLTCVDLSRTLESFANGRISWDEFYRHAVQGVAIAEAYQSSGPSLFDLLKSYTDSLPKTYNCYGNVSGNQVYAQCR